MVRIPEDIAEHFKRQKRKGKGSISHQAGQILSQWSKQGHQELKELSAGAITIVVKDGEVSHALYDNVQQPIEVIVKDYDIEGCAPSDLEKAKTDKNGNKYLLTFL
jgi:hypothetical protein